MTTYYKHCYNNNIYLVRVRIGEKFGGILPKLTLKSWAPSRRQQTVFIWGWHDPPTHTRLALSTHLKPP